MDSLHVECMAQDEGDLLLGAEIGEPIPDEHALDGGDDILPVGLDSPKKGIRRGLSVFVEHGVALLIQDAQVHGSGVQIDSAIKFVLIGVKSHMASSFGLKCFSPKRHFIMPREEALMSIKSARWTSRSAM
jgi:hypothetical protein